MRLSQLSGIVIRSMKANSPLLLSVAAGVGTMATAFLVGRASYKAANVIRDHEENNAPPIDKRERLWDRTGLVWKLYIPPVLTTATTVVCIAGANRMGVKKAVAAQAALAVTERAYSQYRDKVVEEFGARKDTAVRDKVVAEQVATHPPPPQTVLQSGPGSIIFCETFTMRYFVSDMEKIRRAVNDLNAALLKEAYLTFDDFYDLIGLRPTQVSGGLGWTPDKMLELIFSTTLTEDDRPCITFEYNYYKPL